MMLATCIPLYTGFIFHFIYGMSSFPLTFIVFKMVKTTNQVILPFIVDLPIKNGDFPYHNLPYPMIFPLLVAVFP